MNKIALLGGSKFIGPHLINALYRDGHDITIFNRNITCPRVSYPEGIQFVIGDRNNADNIKYLFRKYFDVVFDLSGFIPQHVKPIIFECSQNIGHYIFCSTSSVYKPSPTYPITEDSTRSFKRETYGGAKAIIENQLLEKHLKDNWPITIFRPQAVFGPYDAWAIGLIYYRLINSLPINLNKNSDNRVNPLYIADLVNAFLLAMNSEKSHGAIYGIAGDDIVTLKTLINKCNKNIMRKPYINYLETEDSFNYTNNLCRYWLKHDHETDCSKIKKELGIKFTPINNGINKTISWINNNLSYIEKYSFRGEKYLLYNKPIPMYMNFVYHLLDLQKILRQKRNSVKQLLKSYVG